MRGLQTGANFSKSRRIIGPEHEAVELFPRRAARGYGESISPLGHVSPDYGFRLFCGACVLSRPVIYERYVMADNVAPPWILWSPIS